MHFVCSSEQRELMFGGGYSQHMEGMPCSGGIEELCVELGAESWFSCYPRGAAPQESSEGLGSLLCFPDLHSEWEHCRLCDGSLSLSGHKVSRVLPHTRDGVKST